MNKISLDGERLGIIRKTTYLNLANNQVEKCHSISNFNGRFRTNTSLIMMIERKLLERLSSRSNASRTMVVPRPPFSLRTANLLSAFFSSVALGFGREAYRGIVSGEGLLTSLQFNFCPFAFSLRYLEAVDLIMVVSVVALNAVRKGAGRSEIEGLRRSFIFSKFSDSIISIVISLRI